MFKFDAILTLVGGPTILIKIAGVWLLTDPTFDPPGLYEVGSGFMFMASTA